jgi:integrase/recombinase XerD
MPKSRPKAPPGTFWRGDTLYGRTRVKGRLIKWSLETDNPRLAAARRKAGKDRIIAIKHGDATRSFDEVMEEWSVWIEKQVGPATAERYACSLDQLAPWLDRKDLTDIDGELIAQIVAERSKKVSNATLKRDLVALSSVLNYCIDQGYREDNPVLPRLRRVKERRDPIVLPQLSHIMLAANRAPGMMGDLMRAAMATGARQEELLRAQRDHIDDARRQITLIGKGNKLRVIDLTPFGGFDTLTALPASCEARDRYLFWHGEGQRYAQGSFKGNFRKFIVATAAWTKENGIDFRPFRFHDLRHWHAVHYLKDRIGDIYALQERLGHTSLTVTEGYLKYLTAEEKLAAKHGASGSPKSIPCAPVSRDTKAKEMPTSSA